MEISLTHDLSVFALIAQASWVVKGVMLLLALASFASWYVIFDKAMVLRRERRQAEKFNREFWGGGHTEIIKRIDNQGTTGSMERVFHSGRQAYLKALKQRNADPAGILESSQRAMRAAYQREMDLLESHLPFLATVGSVSPYVGLFGTVWGIMNAFIGLSDVAQATLAQVAPGIAEALIATAIGLFAAIPAVIAYNRFTHDIDRLANQFDVFMDELSNVIHSEIHRHKGATP